MEHAAEPDFYLASTEGYDMDAPRACWRLRRLANEVRDDLLLIRIDPPVIGQQFGLGDQDIDEVIVATRHQGASLFPISEWPLYVHVARLFAPLSDNETRLRSADLHSIAWAELYPTLNAARLKRVP